MEFRQKLAGYGLILLLILTWGIQAGATYSAPEKENNVPMKHGYVSKAKFDTQEAGVVTTVDFQK